MTNFRSNVELWESHGSVIRTRDGEVICRLDRPGLAGEETGRLIAAAPRLVAALRAAIEALEEIAVHIPPNSTADIVGARAVTLAYSALELAGTGHGGDRSR